MINLLPTGYISNYNGIMAVQPYSGATIKLDFCPVQTVANGVAPSKHTICGFSEAYVVEVPSSEAYAPGKHFLVPVLYQPGCVYTVVTPSLTANRELLQGSSIRVVTALDSSINSYKTTVSITLADKSTTVLLTGLWAADKNMDKIQFDIEFSISYPAEFDNRIFVINGNQGDQVILVSANDYGLSISGPVSAPNGVEIDETNTAYVAAFTHSLSYPVQTESVIKVAKTIFTTL